jgi:cytochrome c oxidase assembly protein subunit 15
MAESQPRRLAGFAWAVVAWNVAVIVWGAYVRATGAGAGCGRHWPSCQGVAVPRAPALETIVEYTHRTTSGLALLLVLALALWARRDLPAGHPARRAAAAAFGLVVLEALLGAGLVLFGFVARDASPARGWVMAVHLTNTLLLLAALVLAAAWARAPGGPVLPGRRAVAVPLAAAALAIVAAGASGAVAALGDTLYPATSFGEGLRQDLSGGGSLLLRLRVLHPPLAVVATLTSAWAARRAFEAGGPRVGLASAALVGLAWAQVLLGATNLALLAPVGLQLAHLALADLTWIALALVAARALWPQGDAADALARPAA